MLYFHNPPVDSTSVLFAAAERLIPRIRIETRQAECLRGKRIIVAIDSWPRDSRYPIGHYVRSIGVAGDRETENEVIKDNFDFLVAHLRTLVHECLYFSALTLIFNFYILWFTYFAF